MGQHFFTHVFTPSPSYNGRGFRSVRTHLNGRKQRARSTVFLWMVDTRRRKSVSFVEPSDGATSRTRRSGILPGANSPSVKSPAKSALKRTTQPAPGSIEVDGGFRFKRRKNGRAPAAAIFEEHVSAAVPEPLPAPAAKPSVHTAPAGEHASAASFPLATIPAAPTLVLPADATESAATVKPATAPAAAAIEPTLCGAPLVVLHAIADVVQAAAAAIIESEEQPHARISAACAAELARLGVHSAPPADENERLRAREALLTKRVAELHVPARVESRGRKGWPQLRGTCAVTLARRSARLARGLGRALRTRRSVLSMLLPRPGPSQTPSLRSGCRRRVDGRVRGRRLRARPVLRQRRVAARRALLVGAQRVAQHVAQRVARRVRGGVRRARTPRAASGSRD